MCETISVGDCYDDVGVEDANEYFQVVLILMTMMLLQIVKGSSSAFGGESFHETSPQHGDGKRWV